jgi:hypothetical protein
VAFSSQNEINIAHFLHLHSHASTVTPHSSLRVVVVGIEGHHNSVCLPSVVVVSSAISTAQQEEKGLILHAVNRLGSLDGEPPDGYRP